MADYNSTTWCMTKPRRQVDILVKNKKGKLSQIDHSFKNDVNLIHVKLSSRFSLLSCQKYDAPKSTQTPISTRK